MNDKEDGSDESDGRARDEEEIERGVRERWGESGRYRPAYVPERWESENGEGDDAERIASSLPVRG